MLDNYISGGASFFGSLEISLLSHSINVCMCIIVTDSSLVLLVIRSVGKRSRDLLASVLSKLT